MNVGPLPHFGQQVPTARRMADTTSILTCFRVSSRMRLGRLRAWARTATTSRSHRVQKIIPLLYLPYADENVNDRLMPISHAVDQGDIAFAINSERTLSLLYDKNSMHDPSIYLRQTPAPDGLCNIVTVNYILAGLQRINPNGSQKTVHGPSSRTICAMIGRRTTRVESLRSCS